MRVRLEKRGIRVLGVAESFRKDLDERAVLAGVVMRMDLIVDGIVIGFCTVGGMDSTDSILKMYHRLERGDISAIMLNGCIISWFNVIDLKRLHEETGLPIISVSYRPSMGIRRYFIEYFPSDWKRRIEVYENNGPRLEITNRNGFKLYLRAVGLDEDDAIKLVNKFTLFGRVPEPLRVARLMAHSILNDVMAGRSSA